MAKTIAEMAAQRDPLYAEPEPAKWFYILRALDVTKGTNEQMCRDLAFLIAGIQLHPEFVHLKAAVL